MLLHIRSKYPSNPLNLIGISAGTGIIVRYLGDLCLLHREESSNSNNNSKQTNENEEANRATFEIVSTHYPKYEQMLEGIDGCALICPGYDISTCFTRLNFIWKRIVLGMVKELFVFKHWHVFSSDKHLSKYIEKCKSSRNLTEFMRWHSHIGSFPPFSLSLSLSAVWPGGGDKKHLFF